MNKHLPTKMDIYARCSKNSERKEFSFCLRKLLRDGFRHCMKTKFLIKRAEKILQELVSIGSTKFHNPFGITHKNLLLIHYFYVSRVVQNLPIRTAGLIAKAFIDV